MKFHPIAELFPLIEGDDFERFADDVAERGLIHPIVLLDGQILDGRNRFLACVARGVEPRFVEWEGDDPVAWVVSVNVQRRHLNESQRAMVATRLATLRDGVNKGAPIGAPSQDDAADLLRVARRSVQRARRVVEEGTPELVAAVDEGLIPVSNAAQLVNAEPEFQNAVVDRVRDGEKPTEAKRNVIQASLADEEFPWPDGKFRVIYADPPWSYGNTQPDYHPEQRDKYPVMSLDEICALPVRDLALDDSVLFLWVTSPILEESFRVIRAWGFSYKASFVWDKVKHNMGHYNSVRHELLLVATRGSCQPDKRTLFDSVVEVERREHSRKPERFYEIIDTLYPNGPRVELFARHRREGWEVYGNELSAAA